MQRKFHNICDCVLCIFLRTPVLHAWFVVFHIHHRNCGGTIGTWITGRVFSWVALNGPNSGNILMNTGGWSLGNITVKVPSWGWKRGGDSFPGIHYPMPESSTPGPMKYHLLLCPMPSPILPFSSFTPTLISPSVPHQLLPLLFEELSKQKKLRNPPNIRPLLSTYLLTPKKTHLFPIQINKIF